VADTSQTAANVLAAAALVREGCIYSLARPRFNGMPLFPGHPQFQVLTYRSPHGLCVAAEEPWGPGNEAQLGYISELMLGTAHSGAHIDALGHMTIGSERRWHCGNAHQHLGDFGPTVGDATELFPIWRRGLLFDVPGHRGVPCLPKGEPVTADELQAIATAKGFEVAPGDVVLVRTGYMSHWPDREAMAEHLCPGPDISAARWLADRRVLAVGSDTETFEVQPAPDGGVPHNPQPVHTLLLIELGVYIMESLDLEELAADGRHEFLFVALPLSVRGATGSMIDPIAVV
jgi:kynurenine formamidase